MISGVARCGGASGLELQVCRIYRPVSSALATLLASLNGRLLKSKGVFSHGLSESLGLCELLTKLCMRLPWQRARQGCTTHTATVGQASCMYGALWTFGQQVNNKQARQSIIAVNSSRLPSYKICLIATTLSCLNATLTSGRAVTYRLSTQYTVSQLLPLKCCCI